MLEPDIFLNETQQTADSAANTVNGAFFLRTISELHLKLGKHAAVSPPKCLMIGAPKEIEGLSVLQIVRLLIAKESELAELADALMLLENKDAHAKTKDLTEELKSILRLYYDMLTDEVAKRETAPPPEFEQHFQEIPKPVTGHEASAKALRQKFLAKMGVAEKDDLRGESAPEIAKTAVAKTVWEEFFDNTKNLLKGKKQSDALKMLAGETFSPAFSFRGSETKPAHIIINNALLDITGNETAFLILENYLKARMVAELGYDQNANIENFWDLVSVLQILKNPSSHRKTSSDITIKRPDSLLELKSKEIGDQQSKHERTFWGNVKKRHIEEQRECAAQQAELLNKIEAVTSFLAEAARDKKLKSFGNVSRICARCSVKKSEGGVFYSEEITQEQAEQDKKVFDEKLRGNFDSRRHDRTLQPQAEANLISHANELISQARAAALQAIGEARAAQAITEGDRERSRESAAEAWSRVAEMQRRLDKVSERNEQLTGEKRKLAVQAEVQTGSLERLEAVIEETRNQLTAALANPGTFGNELKEVVRKLLEKL
ncbi:hypothetical protein HZC21_01165 [Candidatus Peregrinibacteria bacterium]|nr:hypothetical protein [Candidatus Peregrinibacteria bacterium]